MTRQNQHGNEAQPFFLLKNSRLGRKPQDKEKGNMNPILIIITILGVGIG